MCGIVGIVTHGTLDEDDLARFVKMLLDCSSLGRDATGMFNSDKYFIKAPMVSPRFLREETVQKFIEDSKGLKYLVGHCRAATRGSPTINENNHPIVDKDGRFLLVHNGMIECDKFDYNPKMTDTYIIANAIAHHLDDGWPLHHAVSFGQKELMDCEDDYAYTGWKRYYGAGSFQSSMIVVGDDKQLILSRSDGYTSVYIDKIPEKKTFVFATSPTIAGLKFKSRENEIRQKMSIVFDFVNGTTKYYNIDKYELSKKEASEKRDKKDDPDRCKI